MDSLDELVAYAGSHPPPPQVCTYSTRRAACHVLLPRDEGKERSYISVALKNKTEGAFVLMQAIRRVLVSKACRGAIMFGDKLSRGQCADVMASLSDCALPFQWCEARAFSVMTGRSGQS